MAADKPCAPRCRIDDPEHGGECDPRTERERALCLYALLDAGASDPEITAGMEAGARAAWGPS